MASSSKYGLSYPPLNGAKLQQILARLDPVVGVEAACVIGNWMGGAPSRSMLGNYGQVLNEFTWKDGVACVLTAGLWTVVPIIKMASGAAGIAAGGGKIWTIEDSCPGGPSLDDALASLANPITGDVGLWQEVMGLGQTHREHLVEQQDAQTREIITKEIGYVTAGVSNILKPVDDLLGGIGFITRNALPIGLTVIGVWAYFQYRQMKLLRKI